LIQYLNKLFFVASDGLAGYELWTSDGTSAGTQLFHDIIPGKVSSGPESLTVSNGLLYFNAASTVEGRELWKSNGTPAGTTLVKNIRPGALNSSPRNLMDVNGVLYFTANDDIHGVEFWKSTGTSAGTNLAFELDIGSSSGITNWAHDIATANGKIYISKYDRIYESDGTQAGTREITTVQDVYNGVRFQVNNNSIYFIDTYWGSDSNGESYYSHWIQKIENSALTSVFHGDTYFGSPFLNFTSLGILFPWATEDGRVMLWKSNGTQAGSVPFLDIINYTKGSYPRSFVPFNGEVLFVAQDSSSKRKLWKTDGTSVGTKLIHNIEPFDMTPSGPRVYFSANRGELWKSNGTPEGTMLVRRNSTNPLYPHEFTDVNGTLFFTGSDNATGDRELWKSSGNYASTVRVKDLYPGSQSGTPAYLINFNGTLFFSAIHPTYGRSLWKSDGTDAGTIVIRPSDPANVFSNPRFFAQVNNQLFFVADNPNSGVELYKTDGTPSGTMLVKDIRTGDNTHADFSNPDIMLLTAGGDKLYFETRASDNRWSVWTTDGTASGTIQLLENSSTLGGFHFLQLYNGNMYFSSHDETGGALWSSAGTAESTTKLAEFSTYAPNKSVIMGGILYFDGPYYNNIWRTDGTECGTFMVPTRDGTVVDLSGSPEMVELKDRRVIFGPYQPFTGTELYKLEKANAPSSPCGDTRLATTAREPNIFEDVRYEWMGHIVTTPNPFRQEFNLRVNTSDDKLFSATVVTLDGKVLTTFPELKTNTDYPIGKDIGRGVYLVTIKLDQKTEVRRMVKVN
jgi:ELWxxDGT repeat protein